MEKVLNFLFALGNLFWAPFVVFKTYGWFSPEVGFELPELTYLNIFAMTTILNMLVANPSLAVEIYGKKDSENVSSYKAIVVSVIYAVALLSSYILHKILF